MDQIWVEMYDAAKAVMDEKVISDYVTAGGVAMIDYAAGRVMKLGELTPEWWID